MSSANSDNRCRCGARFCYGCGVAGYRNCSCPVFDNFAVPDPDQYFQALFGNLMDFQLAAPVINWHDVVRWLPVPNYGGPEEVGDDEDDPVFDVEPMDNNEDDEDHQDIEEQHMPPLVDDEDNVHLWRRRWASPIGFQYRLSS
jgi:hypothetical protein